MQAERYAPAVFVMPAVLVVLGMSVFPLIVSLYLSLSRFKFAKGGFSLRFVGLANYKKLLVGSEQYHFLGQLAEISLAGGLLVGLTAALSSLALARACAAALRPPVFSIVSRSSRRARPGAALRPTSAGGVSAPSASPGYVFVGIVAIRTRPGLPCCAQPLAGAVSSGSSFSADDDHAGRTSPSA
jgi:multiple sugar transport system permease protein